MNKQDQFLTTGEFASKAGMTTSSVTKLIRKGKIKAEKKSGKWMISPDQLESKALQDTNKRGQKAGTKKTVTPAEKKTAAPQGNPVKVKAGKMYSVAEFAAMTYLTEFGVKEWLKQGRINGRLAAGGDWQIDAASLELPDVKRLVR